MDKDEKRSLKKIVVTGFGPFGKHQINASWEAVKHLSKTNSEKLKELFNVDLIILEIPVVYDDVSSRVPEIWKQYDPLFVIHVGVSHAAKCLTFESRASSSGYTKCDVNEKSLEDTDGLCHVLDAKLNVKKLCEELKKLYQCIACISDDAGRYLCEFTFYQSLNINPDRTLFIHVPDFDVCPTDVVAQGIFHTIHLLLSNSEFIGSIKNTQK